MASQASGNDFSLVWKKAIKQYEDVTGVAVNISPSAKGVNHLDELLTVLENDQRNFLNFRDKGAKFRKVVSGAMKGVELLSESVSGGVSTVC